LSNSRIREVEAIFSKSVELRGTERAAYIEAKCGDDQDLRRDVETLLEADERPAPVLCRPPSPPASMPNAESALPERVGEYRVVGLVGVGGMGAVYLAEQESPRRTVALKVVNPSAASPEAMRRLQREAQALGMLEHPGIARVYDAGVASVHGVPQPYFAMELVRGAPLIDHARAAGLDMRHRLELIALICDAAHHAHSRGIVHRDLKPGNILVDATGQPKILDFGVARVRDASGGLTTINTTPGQIFGTLSYMSPEQALGEPVDARSDVYALGVILYELLSGRLPVDVRGMPTPLALRAVRDDDPTPLHRTSRLLGGDPSVIAARALEKDPARRYATAADFADDIRRHLRDEPVRARPASAAYRARKFVRRHRTVVVAALAIFASLVVGLVGAVVQASRARDAEQVAELEGARARQELRAANIERARLLGTGGSFLKAEDILWAAHLADPNDARALWGLRELYSSFPAAYTQPITLTSSMISSVAAHPASELAAWINTERHLCISNSRTGEAVHIDNDRVLSGGAMCFAPRGDVLYVVDAPGHIRRWDVGRRAWLAALEAPVAVNSTLVISPSGDRLACALPASGSTQVWSLSDDPDKEATPGILIKASQSVPLAFHSHKPLLARSHGASAHVHIHDLSTGDVICKIEAFGVGSSGAFSPDGSLFAHGGRGSIIFLRDTHTWELLRTLEQPSGTIRSLSFSADGKLLLASRWEGWEVWDVSAGTLRHQFQCGNLGAHAAWTGPRTFLAAANRGQGLSEARGMNLIAPLRRSVLKPDGPEPDSFALSPDASRLAVCHFDGSVSIWDLASGRRLLPDGTLGTPPEPVDRAAADSHRAPEPRNSLVSRPRPVTMSQRIAWLLDDRIVSLHQPDMVDVRDGRTGSLLTTLTAPVGAKSYRLVAARQRPVFAATGASATAVWEAPEGSEELAIPRIIKRSAASGLAITDDGARLAIYQDGRAATARLFDTATIAEIAAFNVPGGFQFSTALSPGARRIASGGWDGGISVLDQITRQQIILRGHTQPVRPVIFHPDGSLLASGAMDGSIRLWDPATGVNLFTIPGQSPVSALDYSRDGTILASGDGEGAITVWDFSVLDAYVAHNREYQTARQSSRGSSLGPSTEDAEDE
jgi:WD40 repeat protein